MSTVGEDKAKRKAAQQRVTAYHEQQLAELQAHVRAALDAHARGETDAFDVDDVIHHYTRVARAVEDLRDAGQSGGHRVAARRRGCSRRSHQLVAGR